MIKFVFWMPKEMKADLKRIAKEKYMSMADVIRMAVREFMERAEREAEYNREMSKKPQSFYDKGNPLANPYPKEKGKNK